MLVVPTKVGNFPESAKSSLKKTTLYSQKVKNSFINR